MDRTIVSSFISRSPEDVQEAVVEAPVSATSGVSWAAIIAGAFVTAALSLALMALSTGIGLSSMSPWSSATSNASKFGWIAVVGLILNQIIAAGLGGYLAGRLRTRWLNLHTDEVHFRDTAHGFLVWAVSLVATAAFLAGAATVMAGGAASGGTAAASSNIAEGSAVGPNDYLVDTMLRGNTYTTDNPAAVHSEALGVLAHSLAQGNLSESDKQYLGGIVAARTGVSQTEGEQRASQTFTQIQQTAEAARKATAHALYWTFLALLIGAFAASVAATMGGRQRDRVA